MTISIPVYVLFGSFVTGVILFLFKQYWPENLNLADYTIISMFSVAFWPVWCICFCGYYLLGCIFDLFGMRPRE